MNGPMPRFARPLALLSTGAVCLAGSLASLASEPAPTAATATRVGAQDPLLVLREKLAGRLGATAAPKPVGGQSRRAVQVMTSVQPGELQLKPAAASGGTGHAESRSTRRAPRTSARTAPPAHDGHWSYVGETGPAHWARLSEDFELCAKGQRQSPIDIRDGFVVELEPITFDYRPADFTVTNNGHSLQVSFAAGNRIALGGRSFELLQMHFHHPAEEAVEGQRADMSAHLVHRDASGRLAVVAVQLRRGVAQPLIQQVWNNLPLEAGEPVRGLGTMDPNDLLPADRRYFTYMGSLTTPPCTEGVQWMVLKQTVELSEAQVRFFARLFPMNARPLQSAAGRIIKQSN